MRLYIITVGLLMGISIDLSAQSPSTSQNFVQETSLRAAGKKSKNDLPPLPVEQANRNIQYLDGLGRPLQTVQWQASPLKRDIVQPVAYDAFGREAIKYLPYADIGSADGGLRATAVSAQAAFYGTNGWDGNVAKTPFPYSRKVFEASPLSRVLEQGAPGAVWQPAGTRNSTSGRTVVQQHGTNTATEVKLWTVSANTATSSGSYAAGRLYKSTTNDENWNSGDGKMGTVDSFTDLEGRVVLKRAWEDNSVSLDTYYIYDDLGNLRYVVPPAVTVNSFTESDAGFTNFIYGYHYDGRRRNTRKHVPGKGWEEFVYNKLDQLVMSQDAKGKLSHAWMMNKYDAFGRLIITGIYEDNISRDALQASFNSCQVLWETQTSAGAYTNTACPTSGVYTYLTVNYYDSYNIPGLPSTYNRISSYSNMLKGLPTATLTNVLGTAHQLWTVMYYDNEGRVVKTFAQHYKGGVLDTLNYDETETTYSFVGEVMTNTRRHFVSGTEQLYVANAYTYDHVGRKLQSSQKTGTNAATGNPTVVLSNNSYNETGQLKQKQLHSADGGTSFLHRTKYAYNERGWLKNSSSPEFSMKLGYDTLAAPQYNGNISAQLWGNSYGNQFLYGYDRLNRLTTANSTGVVMGETLSYDKMGNIQTLNRDGASGSYSYTGNRLNSISGGLATGAYAYDANGNATTDGRKGVTLSYNLLNLPTTATKTGLNLSYTYDASGRKLRKVSTTTGTTTTDYVDGIQYTDGNIEFVQTEEGRALKSGDSYSYQYNLSDHLGNVRYSFDIYAGAVRKLQQDDYYAFGKRRAVTGGSNNYLYNGKELQDGLEQYDYGARFYDPIIGRWNVVDALSENHFSVTPYNYVLNNPINTIDPFGLDTTKASNLTEENWHNFKTKNDVVALNEVSISHSKGEARAQAAYSSILHGVQENYRLGVGGMFQGYPDNLQNLAAEKFYKRYYVGKEIDPFTGRVLGGIGLEDANWIIDLAVGGIFSLVKTPAALNVAKGGTSLVQANRTAGNLFRDELAAALRAEGRTVNTEVFKRTPFGNRYMDLDVWHNGINLGGIEAKVGGSRYLPLQRLKDAWLGANGYPVQLVRKPGNW